MAQHFLLSAAARTLSRKVIFREGEEAAYWRFRRLRWPETDGAPVCPARDCLDFYDLTTRRRFKCAACHHQFSVTSGTVFAARKFSFVDLLGAIRLFVNASKGLSAGQLSRDLDIQYKTAFVLMHKLREVMAAETREMRLSGHVEVDGAAFGGHVLLDQAGWHTTNKLDIPANITLLPLPPRSPELNPVENVWQYMRENWLSNTVFASQDQILATCCEAWTKLAQEPWTIMSIGTRGWAHGF